MFIIPRAKFSKEPLKQGFLFYDKSKNRLDKIPSYSYDSDIDALYLCNVKMNYIYSLELIDCKVIIDVNSYNQIIGLEILDASKVLNVNKKVLENISMFMAKFVDEVNYHLIRLECDST